MKKKLLAMVCMLTCIFGLTACGNTETVSEVQQSKISNAEYYAPQLVTELFENSLCNNSGFNVNDFSNEEIEYVISQQLGLEVDGYALKTAVESFNSGLQVTGAILATPSVEVTVDGNQLICEVYCIGEKKDATAEIILSNDMFLKLESASLNPVSTMKDLMAKAGMNTLIGMGTVFIVLILISLIISCFGFIPKIQASLKDKKAAKEAAAKSGIDNAVAQITAQEETVDETDDLELVAVIAAAIAASEGAQSTDGFVVRSIRRRA